MIEALRGRIAIRSSAGRRQDRRSARNRGAARRTRWLTRQVRSAASKNTWSSFRPAPRTRRIPTAGRELPPPRYVATVRQAGFATTAAQVQLYPGGGRVIPHSATCSRQVKQIFRLCVGEPGAVRIENACTRWLDDVIGYPPDAAGTRRRRRIAPHRHSRGARGRDPDAAGRSQTQFDNYSSTRRAIAGRGRGSAAGDSQRMHR